MGGNATVIHLAGSCHQTSERGRLATAVLHHQHPLTSPTSCFLASLPLTEKERDRGGGKQHFFASLSAQRGRPRFENLAASICQLLRVTGQKGPPARTLFANSDMGRKKKTGKPVSELMQKVVLGCLRPSNEAHRKGESSFFCLPARN